ncbi:hypothetical protein QE152_g37511 [Popillia japonica]|uniref:Uncharacterized protein n=1 Tax=Popillia japonica TaxID=7064 RepID=A0AAW1IAK8_POPJA
MEEINIQKPKTIGEPSDKETPRASRVEVGSVSQDTAGTSEADQQGTKGSGKTTNPTDPDAAMRRVATGMIGLKLAKTRISGVQKRKGQAAVIAAGEAIRPRRKRSNRGAKEQQAGLMKSQSQRDRREALHLRQFHWRQLVLVH